MPSVCLTVCALVWKHHNCESTLILFQRKQLPLQSTRSWSSFCERKLKQMESSTSLLGSSCSDLRRFGDVMCCRWSLDGAVQRNAIWNAKVLWNVILRNGMERHDCICTELHGFWMEVIWGQRPAFEKLHWFGANLAHRCMTFLRLLPWCSISICSSSSDGGCKFSTRNRMREKLSFSQLWHQFSMLLARSITLTISYATSCHSFAFSDPPSHPLQFIHY